MIPALILASHLNFHQVTPPPILATQTMVARSYSSRSSSYSRSSSSFSRPSSSYSRPSAPTRIKIQNSSVQRIKSPTPKSVTSSSPVTQLGPRIQKTTLNSLKDSSGRVQLTKTTQPTPVVTKAQPTIRANPPSSTILAPRRTYSNYSPAPVVIQQESTLGNPWFWLYMMNQDNNRPQVVQTAPVIQQPQELQSTSPQPVRTIVKEKPQHPFKTFLIFSLGFGGGFGLMILLKNRNIIR
jgi:hypothetical protein